VLELYRDGLVAFDQAAALAELRVRWVGETAAGDGGIVIENRVDEEYG